MRLHINDKKNNFLISTSLFTDTFLYNYSILLYRMNLYLVYKMDKLNTLTPNHLSNNILNKYIRKFLCLFLHYHLIWYIDYQQG